MLNRRSQTTSYPQLQTFYIFLTYHSNIQTYLFNKIENKVSKLGNKEGLLTGLRVSKLTGAIPKLNAGG